MTGGGGFDKQEDNWMMQNYMLKAGRNESKGGKIILSFESKDEDLESDRMSHRPTLQRTWEQWQRKTT